MEYIKKIILSDPKKNGVFQQIMEKDQMEWKRFGKPEDIFKWLHNFSTEEEIYLALLLANNILYYTQDQIRYLWRLILTNRVKLFLLKEIFQNNSLPDIEKWFPEYLRKKCIFVGYGKAGKSSQSMVPSFKQSNIKIKGLKYMELFEFLHTSEDLSDKKYVFLLDDFIGSGHQAQKTWNTKIDGKSFEDIHQANPKLKFIYLVLVGFKGGKEEIEKNLPIKVILGEELDERFTCFSNVSIIYKDADERTEAKKVMEEKGKMLYEYPLGYDNMELAVAFYHNTPNNSLPVIWKRMDDGTWYPLFERFE